MKTQTIILAMLFGLGLMSSVTLGADEELVIMLGGEGCESHPEQITKVLMAQKGIKSVDLKKMKGHAVVTSEGSTKPEALVKIIQGLKGSNNGVEWSCDAMIMN
jgi:heavy-metal-associated domain-containing protein